VTGCVLGIAIFGAITKPRSESSAADGNPIHHRRDADPRSDAIKSFTTRNGSRGGGLEDLHRYCSGSHGSDSADVTYAVAVVRSPEKISGPFTFRRVGELLRAVAAFAVGGVQALEGRRDRESVLLLEQMRKG